MKFIIVPCAIDQRKCAITCLTNIPFLRFRSKRWNSNTTKLLSYFENYTQLPSLTKRPHHDFRAPLKVNLKVQRQDTNDKHYVTYILLVYLLLWVWLARLPCLEFQCSLLAFSWLRLLHFCMSESLLWKFSHPYLFWKQISYSTQYSVRILVCFFLRQSGWILFLRKCSHFYFWSDSRHKTRNLFCTWF